MIVDDEPTTREGLATLISWETYGFKVVNTAANGNEAIKKYDNASIDLIIVDIRMPGMSGIELIEKIRKKDSSIFFLILSGHADFEYAKKAITYNVKGYMLKPVDEDELIGHLEVLKKKLEQELEYKEVKTKIDEENQDRIIYAVLKGEIIDEVKDFFHNYLGWDKYRLLLIKLDIQNNPDFNSIKDELKEIFGEVNNGVVFTMKPFIGILSNGSSELTRHQEDFIYRYLFKVFGEKHIKFTAAVANIVDNIEELSASYQSVLLLIKQQFFYGEGHILNENLPRLLSVDQYEFQKEEQFHYTRVVDKLFYAIEIGNKQAVERICLEAGLHMIQEVYSEHAIKTNYVQIVSSLLIKLSYEYQDMESTVSTVTSKVFEIEEQPNIKQLLTYVDILLVEIIENMKLKNTDILVEKMIDLIERNYHKNIKLETLAEVFHYNRNYLGKVFIDYTGEYFNTYLDKVRIENGRRLLLQGLKVYQVAERIGYSNVDYFHSKFKKYEGMSPSAYRKKKKVIGK